MAHWTLTYNRDNTTTTVDMKSAEQPSMDEAVAFLLDWAETHLERGEFGDSQDDPSIPAVRLLTRFGVTITGIAKS
ncbi:hypothetical protein SAMN05216600_102151 [Pseudomonas cuatrocienegasensis]|uniref:Uncharacterized protein n=1 Tax=Pseudomonas cuatrocienegasensis TaxID=543360 RepID=A0ABY1B483_9PSED|nr:MULTISPECIES: hypothetical protein [Pseudomonas]OEC37190.1 hypothetical protein A7D25_00540 [Pseudomonas sp. 21C1]SEP88422.1 hypothetical protein SAMN05216600_102151 [Pseudomonas cuatrocienegasensis]